MNEIEVHESIYYRFFFFYGIQIQTFYLISKTNIYKLWCKGTIADKAHILYCI